MKSIKSNRKYLSMLALFAMACSSLGSGGIDLGGDSLVELKVSADPNSTTIGNALVTSNVTFNEARVVISEIEFVNAANCTDAGEIEYEGPYVVDLLTQKSKPSLDEVQLKKGKYCKFEFKLDKLDDDELPAGIFTSDELIDLSVLIKGTDDDTSTPFEVRLDQSESYELESEDAAGFELIPDQSNTLFLVFNLSKLFDGVDLSVLDVSSGTIFIDKDNNQDAFDIVKENLKNFSRLQKDDNDNDSIDDDDDVIAGDSSDN